jgi:hypothetical protein
MAAGLQRDHGVSRECIEELPIVLAAMVYPDRLSGHAMFIHGNEHRVFLVCVASDKLLHIAAAPFPLTGVVTAYDNPGAAALS